MHLSAGVLQHLPLAQLHLYPLEVFFCTNGTNGVPSHGRLLTAVEAVSERHASVVELRELLIRDQVRRSSWLGPRFTLDPVDQVGRQLVRELAPLPIKHDQPILTHVLVDNLYSILFSTLNYEGFWGFGVLGFWGQLVPK